MIWAKPEGWVFALAPVIGEIALEGTENLQAAQAFEQLTDPMHTLPNVLLRTDRKMDWQLALFRFQEYDIHDTSGLQIGHCILDLELDDPQPFISGIFLEVDKEGNRLIGNQGEPLEIIGKGYGLATHKLLISVALREGYGFQSYPLSLSKDNYELWLRLVAKGVARITYAGVINESPPNFYSYATTRFEILAPDELIAAASMV